MHFRDAVLRVPDIEAFPVLWAAAFLARTWAGFCWEPVPESPDHLLECLEQCVEEILDGPQEDVDLLDTAAAGIWRAIPTDRQAAMSVYLFAVIEEILQEDC